MFVAQEDKSTMLLNLKTLQMKNIPEPMPYTVMNSVFVSQEGAAATTLLACPTILTGIFSPTILFQYLVFIWSLYPRADNTVYNQVSKE